MASTVAGGLFKTFAFAGAGYLFKYFDKNGYAEEAKSSILTKVLDKKEGVWEFFILL